ncbi:hypothetical protein CYLTODRAFT_486448 [Cylindrobasidium torrendii FP15055 ss-10]|uniref:F-box domain-containing protein n=1 Tax=Cylindrobasidium torrendii FP15055 ss-10 TaxID=1314674 RepID=A0A0D7BPS1_9AGAR|nr:hypothetical protein CYLTODRAFT_486448 [Cylindrobasidium torrendii FP15055 ss-10]
MTSLGAAIPLEICEQIFDVAATCDRRTGFALLRVSRDIHQRVEPILYRTIVLSTRDAAVSFAECLSHRKDKEFVPHTLREFVASDLDDRPGVDWASLAPALKNVTTLMGGSSPSVLRYLLKHTPNLQRLTCWMQPQFIRALRKDFLVSNLTHLTLNPSIDNPPGIVYDVVFLLRRLTHLAIQWIHQKGLEIVKLFVDRPHTLRVLLVLLYPRTVAPAAEYIKTIKEQNPRHVWALHESAQWSMAADAATKYDGGHTVSSDILSIDANDMLYNAGKQYPNPAKDDMWDVVDRIVIERLRGH